MGKIKRIIGKIFRVFWRTGAWVWWVISLGTALLLGILWAWNWWLPSHLSEKILPSVADQFGVGNLHCDVRRIGLTGMDIANVSVTDLNGRALGINSVRLDYSFHWPGRDKRAFLIVDQVAISGLQVGIRLDESGTIAIDGLDWAEIFKRLSTTTAKTVSSLKAEELPAATSSGVLIRTLLFENIRFYVAWNEELLVVPAEVRVDLEDGKIQVTGSLELRSGTLDFIAAIDPAAKKAAVKVVGSCPLEHFSGLLPFNYRGNVAYSALVRFPLDGNWPTEAEIELNLANGPDFLRDLACHLTFAGNTDGTPGGKVQTDISVCNPWAQAEIHLAGGELTQQPDGALAFSGTPEFVLTPAPTLPVRFQAPVTGNFECAAAYSPQALWLRLFAGSIRLPELGFGAGGTITASAPLHFEADFHQPAAGEAALNYQLRGGALAAQIAGVTIKAPKWQMQATARNGELTIPGITVDHRASGMRASGVDLTARYPGETATVKFEKIVWNDTPIAGAETHFQLEEEQRQIDFTAKLNSFIPLTETMTLELGGRYQFNGNYEIDARLPSFKLPEGTDLSRFTGGAKLLVSGNISAQASLSSKDDDITSEGRLSLTRLNVAMPEAGFSLKNLNLGMKFSDLLTLRTPTGQRLTAEEIQAGVMKMKHGEISFKIDSPQQINLEDSSIEWCGGTLSTRYLRIIPGRNYYQTTVQCENLNLAEVLTELGLVRAEGEGKVWGQMPIRFSERGMFFNPSYLYSIPGETSAIQIADADVLLNSMSPELARSVQGELTVAALRDFQYNWARMNFSTEGEDLVITMKFNGKPNNALPFRYESDTGSLVKVSAEAGAIFQGIDLDFTARFPLNRMMKLNERLNTIWGKL